MLNGERAFIWKTKDSCVIDANENPPHFIHEINTIAYDVSDVNLFLRTLIRFLRKNKDNSVPPILLLDLKL